MERTPRSKKSTYDVTEPVTAELDDTCFGLEYSPRTVHCQKCHDNTLCLIKFKEQVDGKVAEVEAEHRMLDLERVPPVDGEWAHKLTGVIEDWFNQGQPATRQDIGDALTQEFSLQDEPSKHLWINRWIEYYNISHLIHE